MYKGSDVKDNLVITLKDIIPEVNKMPSIKVEIDGQERGIDLGFVLDLEEEDSVYRKAKQCI